MGEDEEAYDALQEIFVRLLKRKDELEDDHTLLPWLNRVTTNYCLNVIRYRSYRRPDESIILDRLPDSGAEMFGLLIERRELVRRLLTHAKPPLAEVAACYFLDEMTLAEAAEALSLSVATVRRRLKAFVELSRRDFEDELGE